VGSSFKIYVYADALERAPRPFDTIVDLPFTAMSGGQAYSPRNYDEKFEGTNHAAPRSRRLAQRSRGEARGKKFGINTFVGYDEAFRHQPTAASADLLSHSGPRT